MAVPVAVAVAVLLQLAVAVLPSGAPASSILNTGCKPVVWVANSTERVMNGTSAGDPLLPARVSLAGNEYESVQVVVRVAAGCPAVRISVAVSPLLPAAGGGGPPLDAVEWHQVGFVLVGDMSTGSGGRVRPGAYNNCSGGCAGYWPDPLLPVRTALALPNFTSPLWFTVRAPAGARGGEYRATIQLSSPGLPLWRAAVALHALVYNFSLPPVFSFSSAVQLDYAMLYYSYGAARALQLYPAYVRFALQRLHLSPLGPYDSGLGPLQIGCCTHRPPVHTAADLAALAALGGGAAKALFALPMHTTGTGAGTGGCAVNASVSAAVAAEKATGLARLGYLYGFDEMQPSKAGFAAMQRCFTAAKAGAPPGTRAATTAWIGTQYCGPGDLPPGVCVPMDAATLRALDVDVLVPQSNWVRHVHNRALTVASAGGPGRSSEPVCKVQHVPRVPMRCRLGSLAFAWAGL